MNSPASSFTRSIACVGCGQSNPAARKFCGACGGRLWLPCLECDAINATDEKFCGGCGVELAKSLKQHEDQIRSKIELAIELEKEGRYYDAASKLREITGVDDERLVGLRENGQRLLEQLDNRRQQRMVESQQLEDQARVFYQKQQYDRAFESLKAIPLGLRSTEATELMVETEDFYKEICALRAEIKSALKAKQFSGLLQKVDRLVELQPDNKDAQQLATKLARQQSSNQKQQAMKLVAKAERKIAETAYGDAMAAVQQIDPEYRTGSIDQVSRLAKELHWTWEQLSSSTQATPNLLKAAERLGDLAPQDPRVREMTPKLRERLKTRGKDTRFIVPSWVTQPEKTAIGYQVKNWTAVGRADLGPEALRQMADCPGQFLVAYGLALQGVGAAQMRHDLNPKRRSWGTLLSKKKTDRIWGLDIGSTSIKAVELSFDSAEDHVEVTQCKIIPHQIPLYRLNDAVAVMECVTTSMEQFVADVEAKKPRVAVGFPGRLGLARFFDLPPIKSKKTKLAHAVSFEVRAKILMPLDEAVFDFHAFEPVGDDFVELRPIAAVAARKDDLEQWVTPVIQAGCDVALVQCDGFALYNALHRQFLSKQEPGAVIAVVDIGGDATNLVVADRNDVWMRSILYGAKRFDESLAGKLPLTIDQATELRTTPCRSKWQHKVLEILEPDFVALRDEIVRSLSAYPRRHEKDIQLVLGTGGGFSQFGLLQNLIRGNLFDGTRAKGNS